MVENNIIGNCKPGFQRKRFQRLKKGELEIAFEIDLHGKNLIEAENFLDIWLPKLQMEGNLVGIIIHGKGYGSGLFLLNFWYSLILLLIFFNFKFFIYNNSTFFIFFNPNF